MATNEASAARPAGHLGEIAGVFLRIGVTGFGGPAAHVAMLREEVVRRRAWVSDQEFLDLLGAANVIPGPNSTELAIHLGYRRGGWRGFFLAGACFILPAVLIVLGLAWVYVQYGSTPQAAALLAGVAPVILASVVVAGAALARTAVKGFLTAAVAAGGLGAAMAGVSEIAVLAAGALIGLVAHERRQLAVGRGDRPTLSRALVAFPAAGLEAMGRTLGASVPAGSAAPLIAASAVSVTTATPLALFLIFLKIGAALYGSGYVLLAFLRTDLVLGLGWLTDRQLLDAVAVGQLTPGPLFTTATFVGYLVLGLPGAVLATIGIFLPAFVFVGLTLPVLRRLTSSSRARSILDGVNAAALGLLGAVAFGLSRAATPDLFSLVLALGAGLLLLRTRISPAALVVAGGLLGLARGVLVLPA